MCYSPTRLLEGAEIIILDQLGIKIKDQHGLLTVLQNSKGYTHLGAWYFRTLGESESGCPRGQIGRQTELLLTLLLSLWLLEQLLELPVDQRMIEIFFY